MSRGFKSLTFHKMKGEAFIDIMDSAEEHDKDTREGGTPLRSVSREKSLNERRGHPTARYGRVKAADGDGTIGAGLKA